MSKGNYIQIRDFILSPHSYEILVWREKNKRLTCKGTTIINIKGLCKAREIAKCISKLTGYKILESI